MYCYKCGCELNKTDHCPNCGADVATYKKIIYTSNYLYNDGLEKARVRDLSGAILSLKNALWYNKDNLDARNLLGLIYYEIGETVAALSEWVISKNINDEKLHHKKNLGAEYLSQVQASRQTMDNLDSTIERYNHALECCYSDNLDVAVLQLKKVLQINPHYLRARQLLALLYIEGKQYRNAAKELQRCQKLDISNTTTLRYMQEVDAGLAALAAQNGQSGSGSSSLRHQVRTVKTAGTGSEGKTSGKGKKGGKRREEKPKVGSVIKYTADNETIIQPVNSRNPGVDGFGIPSWIYGGIIGLIVGAALVAFIVLPARVQIIRTQSQSQIREISSELQSAQLDVSSLESEIESLESEIEELSLDAQEESDISSEDKVNALMSSAAYYIEDSVNIANASSAMEAILPSSATENVSDAFIQLYDELYPLLRAQILQDHADAGIEAFEAGDYELAANELSFADQFEDPENYGQTYTQRQYYLAYSYYQLYLADEYGDNAAQYIMEATEILENLIANFPSSDYASSAQSLLNELPEVTWTQEEEETESDADSESDDDLLSGEDTP